MNLPSHRNHSLIVGSIFLLLFGFALASCGGDDGDGPSGPGVQTPDTPTNVAVASSNGANVVTWSPVTGATSYNLYWKAGPGATTSDTKVAGATSPYTHSPITNGTLYSYVVTAENSAGESTESTVASGTPGLPPVYVSQSQGIDTNDGSAALPVKTLAKAYELADADGRTRIVMEKGVYSERPDLRAGFNIEGGYNFPAWDRSTEYSSFGVAGLPASAVNIKVPTVFSQLEFRASNNATGNSIALYVDDSDDNLQFVNCSFVAGDAKSGASGQPWAPAADGLPGGNGRSNASDCDNDGGQAGGAGGLPGSGDAACSGGNGGKGGNQEQVGSPGQPGGCSSPARGGSGGGTGEPAANGQPGENADPAPDGANSVPRAGDNVGDIVNKQWEPRHPDPGGRGDVAFSGGGGGGGGGEDCSGFGCNDGGGNGGGGGGGAGLEGEGGNAAEAGHASFAVFLHQSPVSFTDCVFESANGGSGGVGGAGQTGGTGGLPGLGGVGCSQQGDGGLGGSGGDGGSGGGGAGGAGGPSYGLYVFGSAPTVQNPTFTLGTAGVGGAGGMHGNGVDQADPGSDGLVGRSNLPQF